MKKILLVSMLITFLVSCSSFPLMTKNKHKEEMAKLGTEIGLLHQDLVDADFTIKLAKLAIKLQQKRIQLLKNRMDKIEYDLRRKIKSKQVQIQRLQNKIIVTMNNKILFDTAKTELKKEAIKSLSTIIDVLAEHKCTKIYVEGNTDSVPINTKKFPSNWYLSTERSLSVLEYILESKKIHPKRIIVAGRGKYNPIATNKTKYGKQKNRRVEIIISPCDEKCELK